MTVFPSPSGRPVPVIAIHGGAGTLSRAQIDARQERAYHGVLQDVLRAGQAVLEQGGSAADAVCTAVQLLEDCPLFNAGHGAVFTADATHELDAALMEGATLAAGAVAGVRHVRNPILAARAVLRQGQHVLMAGEGAERLARDAGLAMVEPHYFSTEARRAQLLAAQARQSGAVLDHDGAAAMAGLSGRALDEDRKMGTVGAVALDAQGHLAAATSTGGMTNKRPGRVGDSPLIGAGTYADDRTAAVSCTGHGEAFIRVSAAHDICARMAYGGASLEAAVDAVVHGALPAVGGTGGLIAVDRHGNVCLPFNTEGMYRGLARVGHAAESFIFRTPDA
ncbi:isoaspartyl peptidase/L-asparaginase [Acidovorax sp. SUPP950]|uniref:isoaspartyl peptidase/L-asparaginase family protein n=1 Tax=unclassified Acidovorax TaxID=2684926 RepID=UPI0023D62DE8|nr:MULTISPECIES: isoaspartyl peptidase/L-asparaginase [unclassified Acidovorax]GKS76614.1 isoaspartyl peptidase/L-asparaginase [Acidovorax sp. SUPP950]GKS90883.1 isoaspartyl peptidase/L-asparaginase [Acidovorax sp. SUPP2539]GKS95216.1 isoaspartyl peptidase/L-asparaginase [Acidovorax sp. SUPP2825]